MINLLFHVPLYHYDVKEWDRKKTEFVSVVNQSEFGYWGRNTFQGDRQLRKKPYGLEFASIFEEELILFRRDVDAEQIRIRDIWTLKYTKTGEHHAPHNHRSIGYTGILYLEFDPEVHEPVKFMSPWNDPVTDQSIWNVLPNPKPGVIYIWPSFVLHYVEAMKTDKLRMVTSWDMDIV